MTQFGHRSVIYTNSQFEREFLHKTQLLLVEEPINRGRVHAQSTDDPSQHVKELVNVVDSFYVDKEPAAWQVTVKPNLPWAEDHFNERVCGEPLNPPPSEQYWPFAQDGNSVHKSNQKFSHTYPERFWPLHANVECNVPGVCTHPVHREGHRGIRFLYGDLETLVMELKKNKFTRQAYLPVWFPEDLEAARQGERVPCTLGYHFLYDPKRSALICNYFMRSCDLYRFYRDDVYMAGRLLQWIAEQVEVDPGILTVFISNLHCFQGDEPMMEALLGPKHKRPIVNADVRQSYNFGALG